jgi:hypothetical protein
MPTIEANGKDLLDTVKKMGRDEYDDFIEKALSLRMPTKAITLSATETKLIKRISRGLSADLSKRYAYLVGRRKKEALTAQDKEELLELTHEAESLDADRAAALLELAKMRRVPVRVLTKQMGIKAPAIH